MADEKSKLVAKNLGDLTVPENRRDREKLIPYRSVPVWMDKGVPAVDKGKDWGFALSDDK